MEILFLKTCIISLTLNKNGFSGITLKKRNSSDHASGFDKYVLVNA